MEIISILATGGTLLTLAGSTGLGSNLADVQLEQFNNLVNRDCKKVQNSINGSAMKMLARKLFKGNLLCKFKFIEKDSTTPLEYIELAQKVKDLGIAVDVQKLKELTKLSFIGDELEVTDKVWTPQDTEDAK